MSVEGARILERLHADQWISREIHDRVLAEAQRTNEHVLEVLLELGLLSEADLLKYVAALFRTQFVGTEKLGRATIDRTVLELVPVRLAERLSALPILYDRKTHTLSVVTSDLETVDVAKQIAVVTTARDVKCYIARPKAVRAAIRLHYYGDRRPFQALLARLSAAAAYAAPTSAETRLDDLEPSPPPRPAPAAAPDLPGLDDASLLPPRDAASVPTAPGMPSTDGLAPSKASEPGISPASFLETVHVLVALLEQQREDLRGHSALVARLCRRACERMGLVESQLLPIVLAAHLHDVGKSSTYHLTALNVAHYEGHRAQALKSHLAPTRLFEAAALPEATRLALEHLYERYDGEGFPGRLRGKDIPLGARILAAVETYADLTSTARNPFRRKLEPEQAIEALSRFRGEIFDPTVVDVLGRLVAGLENQPVADRHTILLVDPDPEETTILEMRLADVGFRVVIARDAESAQRRIAEGELDAMVTEIDLGGTDGFALLSAVRASAHANLPVLVVTRRGDRESVTRGFELGVADYVVKPASGDVVAAKVKATLDAAGRAKSGRGVSGSLREMALADVVQILSNGRRSGRLAIVASGRSGDIAFGEGHVCEARWGELEGAEAFYAMLLLNDGDFSLDTGYVPARNLVKLSTESLLLEGMRRLDEGG